MKRFIQALLTVLLALGASSTILAQECDNVYVKLTDSQTEFGNQLREINNKLDPDKGLGKYLNDNAPNRLEHINNAHAKSDRAVEKYDQKFFKRQAKEAVRGHKKDGHLVPLNERQDDDENSDGICDYEQGIGKKKNAECAAIELVTADDGFLTPCNPKKKNKGKGKAENDLECDLWFESVGFPATDEEEQAELTEMNKEACSLLDTYVEAEHEVLEMKYQIEIIDDILEQEEAALVFQSENGCVIPSTYSGLAVAAAVLRGVHAGLVGAAWAADELTGQTVVAAGFGGNTSAAAVIFSGAALIAELAYITADEIVKTKGGEYQEAMMDCITQTNDQVTALAGALEALQTLMQQEHGYIMTNDDENTTEIINVLNTPHGQRDEHPKP